VQMPVPAAAFGIDDAMSVLGSVVAGPQALSLFAAAAPANTDDHPVVTYLAPRITYAPDSAPGERLQAVLAAFSVSPDEVVSAQGGAAAWATRLPAYWRARDLFIRSGEGVQPSNDVRLMLRQVREPLLAVLRTSPDFRPAYLPLVGMASALATLDPSGARSLLIELVRLQPRWPEAAQVLAELDAATPAGH
jgi:spermidine synthase